MAAGQCLVRACCGRLHREWRNFAGLSNGAGASFGAFVNLAPGVDGLIHISKIPADKAFKAGQKIDCFVESVNVEERRMSLSLALISKPVGYK